MFSINCYIFLLIIGIQILYICIILNTFTIQIFSIKFQSLNDYYFLFLNSFLIVCSVSIKVKLFQKWIHRSPSKSNTLSSSVLHLHVKFARRSLGSDCNLYTDDTVIFSVRSNPLCASQKLQNFLYRIAKKITIKFNTNKSVHAIYLLSGITSSVCSKQRTYSQDVWAFDLTKVHLKPSYQAEEMWITQPTCLMGTKLRIKSITFQFNRYIFMVLL